MCARVEGQWHDAEGRRTFTRRHPAHDEAAIGGRCRSASPTANAASKPRPAPFPLWRDTAPAERRRLLLEAAEQMLLREAEIYRAAMAAGPARPRTGFGFNVHLAADILREAAALTYPD
ncbi:aldehyde dehydrogenase family protein [Klebsiella pneumoniae subsp. pneumoniae]|nr:aldehyde dehydrogenase family protein [Klebsiella pneumoniae subsp. pneumoniae]